jgi:hypothetical protein
MTPSLLIMSTLTRQLAEALVKNLDGDQVGATGTKGQQQGYLHGVRVLQHETALTAILKESGYLSVLEGHHDNGVALGKLRDDLAAQLVTAEEYRQERDEARQLVRDLWVAVPTSVKIQTFEKSQGWLPEWVRPDPPVSPDR